MAYLTLPTRSRPVVRLADRTGASFVLKALMAVAIGILLGLWATQAALNRGFLFGSVVSGPWTAFPTVGSSVIDPYARAVLARTAIVPVGADEGLSFFATTDSDGRPLTSVCDYVVDSGELSARFWSLSLFDRRGQVVANAANRYAVTSQDALRLDRRLAIAVAPSVQPGNWLPAPATGAFALVLSLYESNSGTAIAAAADTALPAIRRGGCRR